METLEFVIHPDGRVEEKVSGVKGQSCTAVTEALESQLGAVLRQEQTSDYFNSTVHQTSAVTQAASAW